MKIYIFQVLFTYTNQRDLMIFFRLSIFILLLLGTSASAEPKDLQHVSVQLEWKHQFQFAGFYAALEQGHYKDLGLDVEIKEYDSNIDVVSDVLGEVSTYGMSSSHLILERLSGKKIVQLASYLKQNALVLITKPYIKSIEDLKNKKVMAATNELKRTSLAAMFQEHHLSISDIEVVPHSFNIDAFANGSIDAMTAFISNQPFLLDQKQIPYNIFNPADDGIYSYDVELFTSENEAKNHPLRTQNFINATRKGWEYALSHQEEIVELIYQKYSKEKSKEALLYEAKIMQKLMKTDLFKIGAVVPELTQLNTNMYVQLGMVDKHWDLEGFVFDPKPRAIDMTPAQSAFVKAHPVIRFSDVKWEPFASISDDNTYSGIFKAYYRLLEQRTGIKFEFVKIGDGINFQLVLDALKRKEIDMIDGSGKTKERKEYALFSGPIMQVSLAIVSHKQNRFTTLESLKGKRIAVAKGSTASEYIKEHFPQIDLIYTKSIDEALNLVATQKADAGFDNLVVLDHIIENNPYFHQIEISGINDYAFDLYALIRDDYTLLHQIMDKAVKSISREEILSINNKLLRSTIKPGKKATHLLMEKEKEYLSHKKDITMCIDPNWMPFEKIEAGKHIGMSAEYINIIEAKIGIPITLVPTKTWMESIEFAKTRKCDILSLVMETPERKKYMNFTKPYLNIPLVVATTNDKFFISDLQKLKGKKISIVKGYAFTELLKIKYPQIQLIEVNNVTEGLAYVVQEKTFGFIDNLTTISYQIQKSFPGELKIAGRMNEKWELGIGVRNDDPILFKIFENTIDSIDEKTKQRILNQWIAVKYEQGTDYRLSWYILTPFLLLALILLISQYILRQYNKNLKNEVTQKVEELRQKDEILLKEYRMAEMGEMLSMIAHQWRQPLGAINSAIMGVEVKLASGKFNLDDKNDREKFLVFLEKKHHSINDYVHYLSTTTDDFRNFFNPNKSKTTVSLTAPVEHALSIIQIPMQNSGIKIVKEYQVDTKLSIHQNEVMQVVLNLLKNSEDNFIVKNISDPKVTITTRKDNGKLIISICDNGKGISEDIIDKIFDPYFSTKDEKNGTGLGLYMSKIIIEDHHDGILNVRSTKDGVCFEIIFKAEELTYTPFRKGFSARGQTRLRILFSAISIPCS